MDVVKLKDDYFNECKLFKDEKKKHLMNLLSQMTDAEKQDLKTSLIKEIKAVIAQRTNNGNYFQTETTAAAKKQFSQSVLDDFRSAILNTELKIEANIWESPKSFKKIIENMSYDELNEFYSQCLAQQKKLISKYSNDKGMFFDYYNRDLIQNIEILMPLLSFDFSYQSKRDVVGGSSFWGRKNNEATDADNEDLLKTLGFYKNLLIAVDNNIFCDAEDGFLNESCYYTDEDVKDVAGLLLVGNPNICKNQNEYITQTENANYMLRCRKVLLEEVVIDKDNKFEIYGGPAYKDLFVMQYKISPNNFANRVNHTTDATRCEIILFYLPDKTIASAFQLGRLDMYSENNFHKPYGKSKIDTTAHIHIYSIEDAALNNQFDKEQKELYLANYDMFRNLPKSATYEEYEMYFRKICGINLTRKHKQFYKQAEDYSL